MRQRLSSLARSAAVAAAVLLASASVGRADPLLPADRLEAMVANKDFKAAAAELTRVLGLRRDSPAAQAYDMVHMYDLEATNELNQGHLERARHSAEKGAAEAAADDRVLEGAEDLALGRLIARSPGGTYTARGGTDRGKKYNIVDVDARQAAYPALFVDEMEALKADKWAANAAAKIGPVLAAADKFEAVRAVEKVATGGTTDTDKLAQQESRVARKLIDQWIKDRNADMKAFAKDANKVLIQAKAANVQGHVKQGAQKEVKQGLTQGQRTTVKMIAAETAAIDAAVAKMDAGFAVPEAFDGLHEPAMDLNRWANGMLTKFPG